MKLSEYLDSHNLSYAAFGKKIGTSDVNVWRWANGERFPVRKFLHKITKATNGKVTANDFVEAV